MSASHLQNTAQINASRRYAPRRSALPTRDLPNHLFIIDELQRKTEKERTVENVSLIQAAVIVCDAAGPTVDHMVLTTIRAEMDKV